MNFSMNQKTGRLLCLILAVTLVGALLAGCGGSDAQDDTNPTLNLNLSVDPSTTPTTEAPTTEATEPNENMGTVLNQLTVYVVPSVNATVRSTLYAGDRVEIIRQETAVGYTWGYIPDPVDGWVIMDYIQMDVESADTNSTDTPASTNPANDDDDDGGNTTTGGNTSTTTQTGTVTANGGLLIRSEASTTSNVVGSYSYGDTVTILETSGNWGRTNRGWISLTYVNTTGGNTTTGNNNTTTGNTNVTGNGSTTVVLRGVVTAAELNIRASATQDSDRLGSYTYGTRVEVLERSGNWGRTSKGWISLSYVYQDGTTGTNTATGTITATNLNIRSGPGTGYDSVGSYNSGDTVNILEQFTYNGTAWGCTSRGWISMEYVNVTSGTDLSDGDDDDDTTTTTTGDSLTGTVTAQGGLRIRSGAGSDYGIVGSLDYGDTVTITSRTIADDTTWGRIAQGWICLDYVQID